LRDRVPRQGQFNGAMDDPYDGRSYFPPTQLLQVHNDNDITRRAVAYVMTQMTAKAGLKKYGQAAVVAMVQEFGQFEDLKVYEPVDPATLTKVEKKGALRAINLIKEKRDGRLRGRTVADGRPQKDLYPKSETASPTVATDALMLTVMADAHENRDVGTADVAAAYLRVAMKDFVIMKFTGDSVDILCEMNPEYRKFVCIENGQKVLYVRLLKAIYGCVKSALLWYEMFSGTLKDLGFIINPYDPCVANCMINGKQCTVAWYVDDMKISHVDPDVVTDIIKKLEQRFDKMTVTRGKEHVFLGMNIKFTGKRTAIITMKHYLEEAIADSGLNITKKVATPARKYLFDVDDSSPLLNKEESESFHSVVAKLLYVSLRARMDLLLAIGFLCTRVSKSTKQDQMKLKRVLEYINGTMDLEYTLGADDLAKMRTWVDASYAVHPDMKSHTGGVISFGTGGIVCKSTKQKLNTKSSTEAELVGASDYLPNTIWVKHFLDAQGFHLSDNVLEQDNESAIKLEKNGRSSAGQKSRHINVRYFWIKDRVRQEGIHIRHCPTLQMLADFFTKPLEGALFRRFRDVILGYKHVDSLSAHLLPVIEEHSPSEERVGEGNRIAECGTEMTDEQQDVDNVDNIDDDGFTTVRTRRTKQAKHALRISKKVNDTENNNRKSVSRAILLKQSS
jgi:hypothetical protein